MGSSCSVRFCSSSFYFSNHINALILLFKVEMPSSIIFREAQIVGDFNGWNGTNHCMEKNEFGIWSIKIYDLGGKPAISHNSRVKFRFKHGNGVWIDRIPAWIKYATVDPTKFAAPYDGVYWDPPPLERYLLPVVFLTFIHISLSFS